jgi:acyl carrier protein
MNSVFDELVNLIVEVLDGYDLAGAPITRDSSFRDDLAFESIDIVVLASLLGARYGTAVNLPKYLAGLELDKIIDLRVGDLVDYVESRLVGA